MSLLMDALRKAEEAKKLAAKQASEIKEQNKSAIADETPVLDAVMPTKPFLSEPEETLATSQAPMAESEDLEEAFEFEIDESFGMDLGNSATQESSPTETPAPSSAAEIEDTLKTKDPAQGIEFDLSGLSLVANETESDKSAQVPELPTASNVDFASALSLEEREEPSQASDSKQFAEAPEVDILAQYKAEVSAATEQGQEEHQYLQRADLQRLAPQKNQSKQSAVSKVAPGTSSEEPAIVNATETATVPVTEPLPILEPTPAIRALREEDEAEATEAKRNADTVIRKAGAAIESRKRESARAVFNAKIHNRDSGRRGRLVALITLAVLIPLGGLGFWLFDPLGVFSNSSQFNIPVASYDPNRTFPDAAETVALSPDNQSLPDVSQVQEVEQLIAAEESPLDSNLDIAASADVSSASQTPDLATPETPALESVSQELPTEPAQQRVATEPAVAEPVEVAEVIAEIVNDDTVASAVSGVEPEQDVPVPASAPINIVRTETPQVDPQLRLAYSAYRNNDFVAARAHYQQALRNFPNNRDALLGLAAVSLKIGEAEGARVYYTKLLELDPRDPLARVGLLETVPASDSIAREGELRTLFNEHPNIPQLAFALGNLQASQGRWNDAQQSYYDALLAAKSGASGPVTPDYAFNLAVSLERLNQLRSAYDFYREALTQSQAISPTFDVRILRERLDALERALP